MARLVCYFSANHHAPSEVTYVFGPPDGPTVKGCTLLSAAIATGQVPLNALDLVIRPVLTPEARRHEQALRDVFVATGAPLSAADAWQPVYLENAGSEALNTVIGEVLDSACDDAEVLIEPTLGPRSLSFGLVTSAIFLRALKPKVHLRQLLYAETVGKDQFHVHDISQSLTILDWARDAQLFTDALLAGPLLERLGVTDPVLAQGLAAGLTPKVIAGLRTFPPPGADSPAARHALGLVNERLGSLAGAAAATAANTLDVAWLNAELELAEAFARAGRFGDAARVVREWVVSLVLFASGPSANWMDHRGRGEAERWITGRFAHPEAWLPLLSVANKVHALRNPLSHAGYAEGGEHAEIGIGEVPGLVAQAREWWTAHRIALPMIPRPAPPTTLLWFGTQPSEAVARQIVGKPPLFAEGTFPNSKADATRQAKTAPPQVGWAWIDGPGVLAACLAAELQGRGVECHGPSPTKPGFLKWP
ncbi:hypothetical protein LBMAG42_55340 [Deltaproteobacteria bacterium]|nr:hypothetical protein LBMAG42_55340 [Deltaproteobacteria bacterium]